MTSTSTTIIECVQLEKQEDYPFYHPDEEEGKSICTAILDLSNEDRVKYCDKTQLNKEGKYRTPKVTADMIKTKIKEREDAPEVIKQQAKIIATLVDRDEKIVQHAKEKEEELIAMKSEFDAYKAVTEARFNKLATLIEQLYTHNV